MLSKYFGFREEPFGVTPDPRCLYPSQTHREALASISYGFQSNRGFTAMIAPPGMGKTTLLRRFLEDVRETTCCVFLFDIGADCEPREFTGYILREIGITPANSSAEMHDQLSDALVQETRAGRQFVVVIDEAQSLSDAVLERVRLLTNFETSQGKLMHVVLSGQPQLSEKLTQPSLLQLRQRISTICKLEPLSAEETDAYIAFRLKQVGYDGEPLFTKDALKQISQASQGIPRTINTLCFNALSLCCALKGKRVDESMVAEVVSDLRLTTQTNDLSSALDIMPTKHTGKTNRWSRLLNFHTWVPAATMLLVICVLGLLGTIEFRSFQSRRTYNAHSMKQIAPQEPAQTPLAANPVQTTATTPSRIVVPFAVTVGSNQTLKEISVQYLGGYDRLRLRQIQTLNPEVINPDHIETGQKILLPISVSKQARKDTTHQGSERTIR